MLAGAYPIDTGEILVNGTPACIGSPSESQALGIETIYQTLALADNLDSVANLFLEPRTRDPLGHDGRRRDGGGRAEVFRKLNPNFTNIRVPVRLLSGGQRQCGGHLRALYFNARVLIMDEPCAALGPHERLDGGRPRAALKADGVGIFLITYDMSEVFELSDRYAVMKTAASWARASRPTPTRTNSLALVITGKRPGNGRAPG